MTARSSVKPLFIAAAASYTANCALGAGVKTRVVDSSGFHWAHHALYVATCVLGAAAASTALWGTARTGRRSRAGWLLLPAAVPLGLIPAVSARSGRHILIGLAAAPFFAAATIAALRGR